jgi:hypothetical protein
MQVYVRKRQERLRLSAPASLPILPSPEPPYSTNIAAGTSSRRSKLTHRKEHKTLT